MLSGDEIRTGVFIDDRPTYNYAGIIDTHRSIWVTPCGSRICWYSGRPDSMVLPRTPWTTPLVRDMSGGFFLPDDMVGRVNPYGMWSVYDRQGAVESLSVTLRDGTQLTGQRFTSPTWDGAALYVVLAPWSEVQSVDLVETDGDVTHQPPRRFVVTSPADPPSRREFPARPAESSEFPAPARRVGVSFPHEHAESARVSRTSPPSWREFPARARRVGVSFPHHRMVTRLPSVRRAFRYAASSRSDASCRRPNTFSLRKTSIW